MQVGGIQAFNFAPVTPLLSSNTHELPQQLSLIPLIKHISSPYRFIITPSLPGSQSSSSSSIMKNSLFFLFLFNLVFLNFVACDSPPSSALQTKCSGYFTNLAECLSYATAKADEPTSACCGSVGEIRKKDPVCLCYMIQQVHSGSSTATSMGLQLDRLIKLPAACKLADANVGNCPKLLNLPPSSPDYAIFNGTTTAATSTPSGSSSGSSSSGNIKSKGNTNKTHYATLFIVTVISAALCLSAFF